MLSLQQVFSAFAAEPDSGLKAEQIAISRTKFGVNRLTPLRREPLWRKFLDKFDEPIIKILLAAALLSIVVDLFKANAVLGAVALAIVVFVLAAAFATKLMRQWLPSIVFALALVLVSVSAIDGHPSYEGLAVMIAVVLATGVAFFSEYKSDREFAVLNAQRDEIHVKVIRGGEFHSVPLEEIVVGDLVTLETGDEIPADGRLLKGNELSIDQSLMTGESLAVPKAPFPPGETADGPEQPGCLYRGTQVADGVGQMVVCAVGDGTMIGQIAATLSSDDDNRVKNKLTISKEQTPLQEKLTTLAGLISKIGYIAAGLILAALIVFGLINGKLTSNWLDAVKYLLDSFVYTVIVIVVAVPEGLPMSVTVSLALAMRKMTRANSLVRQLVACETIGSATVICSDKTGTMTQNKMQAVRFGWGDRTFDKGTPNWVSLDAAAAWPRVGKPIDWIALIAAVNSTAHLEWKDEKMHPVGNATEGALLRWLNDNGVHYQQLRLQFPAIYQIHFSSERKRMTTVMEYAGQSTALVKGAAEVLIDLCTHYLTPDGETKPWTPEAKAALQAGIAASAAQAMRTLGFAFAFLPPADDWHTRKDELEKDLVFAGFVAIRDPLRDDVKDAIARCRDAGIEVKMITGDNIETARAIANEIGLLDTADAVVLTHDEFEALSDDQLLAIMPRLRVLARARPLDKLRIVHILQAQNHVVAMTGDGTNDAPALRRADVGLAMGISGTEVAKEASKIVLLDDAFSTIVKAVEWGRSLYENIQRFIQFQLTINVSALTIAFLGPFLGIRPPFTVLMLLWINVIMDTFASIALCSEPPRDGLMKMKPKRRDEGIVTREMLITIFSTAAFFVVVMIALLVGMKYGHWFATGSGPNPTGWEFDPLNVRQVTFFFTIYVLFQIWNQINCRSLMPDRSGLKGLFRNPTFLIIASLTLIGQIAIVTIGGAVFKVEPLSMIDWLLIAAGTASVLVFAEVARALRGKRMANQ